MKKVLIRMFVLAAIALLPTTMFAQTPTDAAANIIAPISLSKTADLHFGTMSVSATVAGTCVLYTSGDRDKGGGVVLSPAAPTPSNAAYSVSGQANASFAITLPGSFTVTDAVSSQTMPVDNLTARVGGAGADGTTGSLSAAGTATFTVGGTLHVAAGQTAGLYEGFFDVSVAYN